MNPPYDLAAWGRFRDDIESKISAANAACRESSQSCDLARDALRDLRPHVPNMANALTTGSPPPAAPIHPPEAPYTNIGPPPPRRT